MNQPLVYYFEKLMHYYNLRTYNDIANYLGISKNIVNNAYSGQTIYPSRQLVQTLSVNQNIRPEIILNNIYGNSFSYLCSEYIKIVTLSLYYNFDFNLCWNQKNYIQSRIIEYPIQKSNLLVQSILRQNRPELKFTGVVDWSFIRESVLNIYTSNDQDGHEFISLLFNDENVICLTVMNYLYAVMNFNGMSEFKRVFVVFDDNQIKPYGFFRKYLQEMNRQIVPLLYDENAKYSIRDTDWI